MTNRHSQKIHKLNGAPRLIETEPETKAINPEKTYHVIKVEKGTETQMDCGIWSGHGMPKEFKSGFGGFFMEDESSIWYATECPETAPETESNEMTHPETEELTESHTEPQSTSDETADKGKLLKIDKNGTKYWSKMVKCWKCNGRGTLSWTSYRNGVCFDCDGFGEYEEIEKEYTPEYQAKLEARRAKRAEKKMAEERAKAHELNLKFFAKNGFNADGVTWAVLGDTFSIKDNLREAGFKFNYSALGWHGDHEIEGLQTVKMTAQEILNADDAGVYVSWNNNRIDEIMTEAQQEYERARSPLSSQHVGEIGERIELEVTLWKMASFRVKAYMSFYNPEATEERFIYSFIDKAGNCLIWKTGAYHDVSAGDKLIIRGTIKAHTEYNEIKQTELTRCKITKEDTENE